MNKISAPQRKLNIYRKFEYDYDSLNYFNGNNPLMIVKREKIFIVNPRKFMKKSTFLSFGCFPMRYQRPVTVYKMKVCHFCGKRGGLQAPSRNGGVYTGFPG